jgi:hypothetical protein
LDRRKLETLGLKKLDDDSVVLNINNRPITTLELEHGCCDNYYVVERRAGGSKGLSKERKLTFPHCHPVPSSNLNSDFAVASLPQFKSMVDDGEWEDKKGHSGCLQCS